MVWNKLQYVKDPDTGKGVSRINTEDKWIRKDVPELQIVSNELWEKVKRCQKIIKSQHTKFWGRQRPKKLFTGMLKCGCCGGGFTASTHDRYACFNAEQKGTCDNRLYIPRTVLEGLVLNALQKHLMELELCKVFCDEYTRYMNELRMKKSAERVGHEAELKKRMADQIREMSGVSAALNPELNETAGNPAISGDSSYSGKMLAGAGNQLEVPSFDPILAKMVAGARNQLSPSGQAIVIAGNQKSLRFDCLEKSMGHRVNASKVVRRLARS